MNKQHNVLEILLGSSVLGDVISSLASDFTNQTYPPANIMKINDGKTPKYRLELGVPGFKKDELEIQLLTDKKALQVKGIKVKKSEKEKAHIEYMTQKLAKRSFTYNLMVPEYTEVLSADLVDGILTVDMIVNTPKEKPLKVEIN